MQNILLTVISCKWSWVYVHHQSCCQLESHWISVATLLYLSNMYYFETFDLCSQSVLFTVEYKDVTANKKHFSLFVTWHLPKCPMLKFLFSIFFFFQSQTCTQTQKPLCIASCFKYCDSTMCCPFSAWAKDLCSVSVDYQVPSLLYLLSAIPIHLTFH